MRQRPTAIAQSTGHFCPVRPTLQGAHAARFPDLTDIMVAAYCPVVANLVNLTVAEKWRRMRQFDTILRQQLAANMMPPGSLVIANVRGISPSME
jgi:hypothetical protein